MLKSALLLPYYVTLTAMSCGFPKGKASGGAPDFLSGGTPDSFPESPEADVDTQPEQRDPSAEASFAESGAAHAAHHPPYEAAHEFHDGGYGLSPSHSSASSSAVSLSADTLNNEFLPPRSPADSGYSENPPSLATTSYFCPEEPLLGGQAVMEGVLMRNGPSYAQAIRQSNGDIVVERRRWYSFIPEGGFLKKPFIRGFSILVETLINGVKALNRSAVLADGEDELSDWQLTLMLMFSLLLALGLFIVVPHLMTLGMSALGLSSGMKGISFHIWDGLFKFAIFIGYIAFIAMVPEIRRVFQYHGAEHKTIACYEHGGPVSVRTASRFSRLHPRCGTTFLLFVLSLAILLHTVLVPLLLWLWEPQNSFLKHTGVVCFKIFLMIPISALAYELIRFAAKLGSGFLGSALRAPGLLLQCLTTREPDDEQLEVAITALYEALSQSQRASAHFEIPAYTVLE